MEVFKCDKCGKYIDNVGHKRIVKLVGREVMWDFSGATKEVELCTDCYKELQEYLGIEETPKAAVSHEPDLRYRQEEWIPCTERLPEKGQYVLCSVDRRDEINECRVIITMFQDNDFWHNGRIYAWRPLPEPLEKEEEE